MAAPSYRRVLLSAVAAACSAAVVHAHVVSIGLQAPFSHPVDCVEGWQYFHIARTAVRFIESTDWWKATGTSLRLEVIPSGDPYTAWLGAQTYATGPQPTCTHDDGSECRVLRAGIVGPSTMDETALVKLVTREAKMPHFAYQATGDALTQSPYKRLSAALMQPFFRIAYSDELQVGALYAFIKKMEWKEFSIVYARDDLGDASVVAMQDLVQRTTELYPQVQDVLSFEPGNVTSVDKALKTIAKHDYRVVVLFAFSNDAAMVMQRAYDLKMTGKGWTWLGGEWVREFTWIAAALHPNFANSTDANGAASDSTVTIDSRRLEALYSPPVEQATTAMPLDVGAAATAAAAAAEVRGLSVETSWWGPSGKKIKQPIPTPVRKVFAAMQGVVGVVPYRIPAEDALGGFLDRFKPNLIADPSAYLFTGPNAMPVPTIPSEEQCYLLYNAPVTTVGLPLDLFAPYVFNSVFTLAAGIAEVVTGASRNITGTPFLQLTSDNVTSLLLANGTLRDSPLTHLPINFLSNGDRYDIRLSLVNIVDEKVVNIAQWSTAMTRPTGNDTTGTPLPAGVRATDGAWVNWTAPITWPGGLVGGTPSDRALGISHTNATALVVALFGIILSLLIGSIIHHAGIHALPESGATILVGAAFGIILRFMFGSTVRETAEFNETVFMLVLLPIIIFESGYTLERRSFFTQLFSISAFAIVGTVISAFVIGLIMYEVGQSGYVTSLTFEESMSFASLLSATDPVATLAVFSSLRVHPMLYALVYGESVINDAVAIVLYRSFTGFLVSDITANAILWAVGSFLAVLLLSVVIGIVVGMMATLAFRYVNVSGQAREVRWERDFISKVHAFQRIIPKLQRLALGEGEGDDKAAANSEETHIDMPDDAHVSAGHQLTDDNVDLLAGIKETSVLLLFGYISFAFAEAVGKSGIVASLICGITMAQYTRRVQSRDGKVTSTAVFKMLSSLADTAIFFQIGLNVVITLKVGEYNMDFILWTLAACLIARAAHVFPLSYFLNMYRAEPIPFNFQLQMWYAGLRGAIAYATVLGFPSQHRDLLVNCTSWICLFTIFALGGSSATTLRLLKIPYGIVEHVDDRKAKMAASIENSRVKTAMSFFDRWIQKVVFGKDFVREMLHANQLAEIRARQRAARQLGVKVTAAQLAANVVMPELEEDSSDEDENASYMSGDDSASTCSTEASGISAEDAEGHRLHGGAAAAAPPVGLFGVDASPAVVADVLSPNTAAELAVQQAELLHKLREEEEAARLAAHRHHHHSSAASSSSAANAAAGTGLELPSSNMAHATASPPAARGTSLPVASPVLPSTPPAAPRGAAPASTSTMPAVSTPAVTAAGLDVSRIALASPPAPATGAPADDLSFDFGARLDFATPVRGAAPAGGDDSVDARDPFGMGEVDPWSAEAAATSFSSPPVARPPAPDAAFGGDDDLAWLSPAPPTAADARTAPSSSERPPAAGAARPEEQDDLSLKW